MLYQTFKDIAENYVKGKNSSWYFSQSKIFREYTITIIEHSPLESEEKEDSIVFNMNIFKETKVDDCALTTSLN